MTNQILHLNLKRKWFDMIKSGEKTGGLNDMEYKSFREQCLECKASGNQIEVDVSILKLKMLPGLFSGVKDLMDTDKILICLKYKSVCHSGACAADRGVEVRQDAERNP